MMSFMSNIGSLLKDYGLSEALATYYDKNVVEYTMSYKIALHGRQVHFLSHQHCSEITFLPSLQGRMLQTTMVHIIHCMMKWIQSLILTMSFVIKQETLLKLI